MDSIESFWSKSKTPLNMKMFAKHVKQDVEHKLMLDCSGTVDQVNECTVDQVNECTVDQVNECTLPRKCVYVCGYEAWIKFAGWVCILTLSCAYVYVYVCE